MAVTVQVQFESVVTQMYQDVFVDSSIENGTTFIQFDLRQLDFQREFGTTSTIYWPKETYYRRFGHFPPNLLKSLDRGFAKLALSPLQSIEDKGLMEMTEPRVLRRCS